jgi:hypothetical protein
MLSLGTSGDDFVLLVIVASAIVLVLVYLLNQLRIRRRDAHLKLDSTQSEDERAFNQIRIARAGADHLRREGLVVDRVDRTLATAEAAQARGDHARALQLAQSARTSLVAIREGRSSGGAAAPDPLLPAPAPAPGGLGPRAPDLDEPGGASFEDAGAPEAPPAAPRLPPHQVEAHFEISVLRGELEKGPDGAANGRAGRAEAETFLRQAEAAYAAESYPDAWRLALKGRRRLGSPIERVGRPGVPAPVEPAGSEPARPAAAAPPSPEPVGGETGPCPDCGRPMRAGDRFCRACGSAVATARCPRCGTPQEASDRFCAVCGAPAGS